MAQKIAGISGEAEWSDQQNEQAIAELKDPKIQIPKFENLLASKIKKQAELRAIRPIIKDVLASTGITIDGEITALDTDITNLQDSIRRMKSSGEVTVKDLTAMIRTNIKVTSTVPPLDNGFQGGGTET